MAEKVDGEKFNLATEVRRIVTKNPELKTPQVLERLQKKYSDREFNKGSLVVAFSFARKQLGIGRGEAPQKNGRQPAATVTPPLPAYDALLTAKKLLQDTGSLEAAAEILNIVDRLQR